MRLKKLEIIGFKSFMEKAAITFPPGISAVVGPNGCGKSNIVDALRWVMGEQSVKQLRGKDKEDIIFAGASGKAPTNLAEVSITLANDNGSAPEEFKDYTEIQVTRRLFRSGESAYLINKQPCRLKDVHNVFIGSGMGARTYSIIGQGNIGAITDAGPDERRFFIEEAAGVTRYKVRKTETLSKIKSTNQNLLRVNDIVVEVERQMEGLKRQAQKAERYKHYQQQIKYFDSRLLCHYFDEITGLVGKTGKALQQLQDQDLAADNRIKSLDASVAETKIKRWEKSEMISSQKTQKFELQRKADRAETELSHFKSDTERLDEEIMDLEDAREGLEIKNQRIELDLSHISEKIQRLEGEITVGEAQLAKESKDTQRLRELLARHNSRLDTQKNELMRLVAEEARFRSNLQNAAQSQEGVTRRMRRLDEEAALADQQKRQVEQKVVAAKAEIAQIKAEIEDYNLRIAGLDTKLEEKNRLLAGQVKVAQGIDYDRNNVLSKLNALKKMAENYEWYKDGVKAVMRAASARKKEDAKASGALFPSSSPTDRPPLFADILGIAADMIEAQTDYQIAVDAALGEALQYIIVKKQADARAAIAYLKTTQAGRGGFIPLKELAQAKSSPPAGITPKKRLIHHVRVKKGFEAVAESLLGHVLVARDLDEAFGMVRGRSPAPTVVTLAGELITPKGVVLGGSQDKLSGILAKKQELKALEQSLAVLEERSANARKEQQELEETLRSIESERKEHKEFRAETVRAETDAEKELYRLTENLKHGQRQLAVLREEQEQLLAEESDLQGEVQKQQRLLDGIGADVQAAHDRIAETAVKVTQVNEELDAFSQYTMDLKLKQSTLRSDIENSRNTLKRLKEFHSDGIGRFEQLNREVAQKREKLAATQVKNSENQALLKKLYKEIEALDKALTANESDFQAIDAVLKENDKQIAAIQSQRQETLKKIRMLELELSEKRIKRENIESRCEERYHVKIEALRKSIVADGDQQQPMPVSQLEAELERVKARLASVGDVNLGAIEEYRLLKERYDFLIEQRDDLVTAIEDLHKVIRRINRITQERFMATFNAVNDKLKEVFPRLFEGGTAWLELTDPKNLLESGVEYLVQPAGKKLTRMSLLSGGEKALSAIAFIFSIFLLKPASFCLMDEIDAPLDDANVFRFNQLLKVIGQNSQIVMITHNKRSMEFADTLFGITMEQKGISKVVSVNLQN